MLQRDSCGQGLFQQPASPYQLGLPSRSRSAAAVDLRRAAQVPISKSPGRTEPGLRAGETGRPSRPINALAFDVR